MCVKKLLVSLPFQHFPQRQHLTVFPPTSAPACGDLNFIGDSVTSPSCRLMNLGLFVTFGLPVPLPPKYPFNASSPSPPLSSGECLILACFEYMRSVQRFLCLASRLSKISKFSPSSCNLIRRSS